MYTFCTALFFIRNELTALYTSSQHLMHDDDDDDDDGDDVRLYSAVTACYCSMFGALGRVSSKLCSLLPMSAT